MAEELSALVSKWLIAQESTYGTDEIDLANNLAVARRYAYLGEDSDITTNPERRGRQATRPSFGSVRGINVRRNLAVNVNGEVIAANDPGQSGGEYPFDMRDFMVAAGMSETIVDSTSATYAPSTEATAGLSIYRYKRFLDATQTWQLIYATGVRGNFQMSANAGEIATWSFEGQSNNYPLDSTQTSDPHGYSKDLQFFGSDGTIALDKNGDSITYTGAETIYDPNPMYFESGTITINSITYDVTNFTINHNNQVSVRLAGSSNPFARAVFITQRGVTVEVGLGVTGAAFEDALDQCFDQAEVSGTFVLTDRLGSGGSTLTVTCPKLQFDPPTPQEVEGMQEWTVPLKANGDWGSDQTGDNEISYAWTVTA